MTLILSVIIFIPKPIQRVLLGFQTEISQMNNRVEDVVSKMKTLKDQIKQISEDQSQVIDILRSIAEKQVRVLGSYVLFIMYVHISYYRSDLILNSRLENFLSLVVTVL